MMTVAVATSFTDAEILRNAPPPSLKEKPHIF
jgi:hypothetical protein